MDALQMVVEYVYLDIKNESLGNETFNFLFWIKQNFRKIFKI